MKSFFSLFSLLFAAAVHAISATGGERLLVLLDDVEEKEQYSTFLGDLESRGFKISYETPKSESLKLFHLGERTFDHVLLFPSKIKSLGPNLTPNILVQFVNAEGNVLLTTSSASTIPSTVANLLAEFDISLPLERTGLVVDHFNYDTISAAEKHDVLVLPAPAAVRPDVKSYFRPETEPINEVIAFPSGVGHTLGASALLTPILRAPKTAYSYNPKEQGDVIDADELYAAGEQLSLVSSFQARNSARFTVVGSADLLSNKWFDAKVQVKGGDKAKTWNREFAKRVAGWTFHEIGVLRVNGIQHYLKESPEDLNPSIYRINSTVSYSVSLSEYSWDSWGPFFVPEDDELQVEFSMLSAYHRRNLKPVHSDLKAATYETTFDLPDQHGVYNFLTNYKRPFLSNVYEKNTVTVRHMAHDEFTRSYAITGAWTPLGGIVITVLGFLSFSAVWMYSAPAKQVGAKKTQ
ncbi:dolichyl-di-phosphooligosaccharide-protein glycotransferase [Verticillium alfalfae VaMs.102]|uniref:Dolichyl-diphosphooligosaccharide--protein glycosyltransferase subunit WBP1 n=1 Tax=Verticillium alfalfae (strain VaMs.102 / ATCC MYA-4576 / FGSC 10136) TaxID=526221 RepID=C9S9M6_VERA1|nr:dolichyl-di-phosphooligosaccharide-protein glycotransferase [Verticillium alfalfae VaMs.102]EEY16089.1 dolichyl-di-phosphooligosaccharide-protein glycotransferase [Verticillium alfalfae VaMs.102]